MHKTDKNSAQKKFTIYRTTCTKNNSISDMQKWHLALNANHSFTNKSIHTCTRTHIPTRTHTHTYAHTHMHSIRQACPLVSMMMRHTVKASKTSGDFQGQHQPAAPSWPSLTLFLKEVKSPSHRKKVQLEDF